MSLRMARTGAAALLASLCLALAAADGRELPALGSLGPDDLLFRQHQELVAASYSAIQLGRRPPDLVLFVYTVRPAKGSVDLLSLAARLNLPYESIATLNGLDRSREFLPGERVLVPSIPGLFVAESPANDLDYLLSYRGLPADPPFEAGGRRLLFHPGARFNPEERALFLGLLFRFPLPSGRLTSGFGMRRNPVTGALAAHAGIDLAAPEGTDVYAAREGVVAETGVDPVLGQYIVLSHDGGFSTVYGHLSARRVRLNDKVESGMILGSVGSTGQSTGPHLHFEVRNRGQPRDPEPLIPRGRR